MKARKFSLIGLMAFVLGTLAAFAVQPVQPKATDVLWGRQSNGNWIQLSGQSYACQPDNEICTAFYPEGQNPNTDPSSPTINQDNGFVQLQ